MCEIQKREYQIVPKQPFRIRRSCAGCGQKMSYCSTGNFRVNANKNLLDVWLIYQCPKCRHTYNLPIYERVKTSQIESEAYQRFLQNDADAAFRCGLDKRFFDRSRVEIDWTCVPYELAACKEPEDVPQKGKADAQGWIRLTVHNPFGLKVRAEKVTAELLQMTGSRVKRMIRDGKMEIQKGDAGKLEIMVRM